MLTTRISWENLRSIDAADLSGSLIALGDPLLFPSYKLKLINNSTVLVTISIDGVNEIDVAPSLSGWIYDETITGNHEGLPAGTQIYVNGPVGTGLVYLVSQYLKPLGA
jgi:hypothetical protein